MFLSIIFSIFFSIIIIFLGTLLILKYYHYKVNIEPINKYLSSYLLQNKITITKLDSNKVVFKGTETKAALIFYPGGNIEHTAYYPLMAACASKGIMCILCQMPLDLAIFKINAAKGIKNKFPEIKKWYIGGHSLGGACATIYLYMNPDQFIGFILLSSYSIFNLSKTNLKAMCIIGTEDKVMSERRYNKFMKNLPKNCVHVKIEGGCHSYFGMFEIMKSDGKPKISNIEQIEFTADQISKLEPD